MDVTSTGGAMTIGGGVAVASGIGATVHGGLTVGRLAQRQETVRVLEQAQTFAQEFGELQQAAGRSLDGHADRLARIGTQLDDARTAVSYAQNKAPLIRNLGIGSVVLGAAAVASGLVLFND